MTSRFRSRGHLRSGRGAAMQTQRTAAGVRSRRNGRWTGHRPLQIEDVREARIRAIETMSEVLP
jgi:hypothetical protein